MKKYFDTLTSIIQGGGLALIIFGVWRIDVTAAFITAGAIVVIVAELLLIGDNSKNTKPPRKKTAAK